MSLDNAAPTADVGAGSEGASSSKSIAPVGEALDKPAAAGVHTEQSVMDAADADNESPLPELNEKQIQKLLRTLKHKVTIDGKEQELDYESLRKGYALEKASTQRFQKASEIEAAARQEKDALARFLAAAQENPRAIIDLGARMGHDMKKVAEDLVWETIQFQKMTPEQREVHEIRKENERLKQQFQESNDAEKKREMALIEKHYEDEIQNDVAEVLKVGGFKPTKEIVARIAEIYQHGFRATKQKMSAQAVATRLRQWIDQEMASEFELPAGASAEEITKLLRRLPKTTVEAFKRSLIEQARATKAAKFQTSDKRPSETSKADKSKKYGVNDYFKNL